MLLKETNYSSNHLFLDVQDDLHSMYVIDFELAGQRVKKNAVVTDCNSKYFKACLTLINLLYKHSDINILMFVVFITYISL